MKKKIVSTKEQLAQAEKKRLELKERCQELESQASGSTSATELKKLEVTFCCYFFNFLKKETSKAKTAVTQQDKILQEVKQAAEKLRIEQDKLKEKLESLRTQQKVCEKANDVLTEELDKMDSLYSEAKVRFYYAFILLRVKERYTQISLKFEEKNKSLQSFNDQLKQLGKVSREKRKTCKCK